MSRKSEKENRVDELINVVEKYTRTERHLEQHSDIASPEQIDHAERIQEDREDEINTLKNKIINGETVNNNSDLENLKANYDKTNEYMHYNASHMSNKDLTNLNKKQKNREEQIRSLE